MEAKLAIREYESSKISKPNLMLGVPEAGLVGVIAASYFREQLKLPEVGYIESDLTPPVIVVHDSKPKRPIRVFGRDDLAVILSEVPLSTRLSIQLASEVSRWAQIKNSELIVGVTGIPSEARMDQEEDAKPNILSLTSEERLSQSLREAGPFEEAILVGTYATLIENCMALNQPNLILLAETFAHFPDPGAAAAVVKVLNKVLSTNVDVGNLIKQSEEIRLRMRELMARTQESMRRMPATAPTMYG